MRLVLCLLTSIAMSTSVAQTSSQDASNKSATDDHPSKATQAAQTEIQQVEDDWLQAERSTNPTALERILANDFVNLTPTGIGPDKETLLENFRQHAGEAPPYSVRQEDMHIYILIGIGAAVTRRPLPHHRAYGSVHGGSSWLR